jgi:hypothetical protein
MNIENFKKVLDQIEKHPETWDQESWHSDCETKHCFAGWSQMLAGEPADKESVEYDAMIFLDVDDPDADYLFSPVRTIQDFRDFLQAQQ